QQAYTHSAPAAQVPFQPAPAPAPSAHFPEAPWITGSQHAVRPRPEWEQPRAASPRPLTSSQEMTPTWLREESPQAVRMPPWRHTARGGPPPPAAPCPPPPSPPPPPPRQERLARPGTPESRIGRHSSAPPEPSPSQWYNP